LEKKNRRQVARFYAQSQNFRFVSVFFSDYLSSNRLPYIDLVLPILMLHIHSSCSLQYHTQKIRKKNDHHMTIFTRDVRFFVY